MKHLLPVLLLFTGYLAHAQSVVLNDSDKTYHFSQHCAELEVQPGQLPIDSLLLHPERYQFVSHKNPLPHDPKRAYWFKLDLNNPTTEDYFLYGIPSGTRIWAYEVAGQQVVGRWELSFYGASGSDAFWRGRAIWPLQVTQHQTHTLYMYAQYLSRPILDISILSAKRLIKETHYQDLVYGVLFGLALLIGFYSFLMGIWLRDRDNLFYALWVFVTGLINLNGSGLAAEWAEPLNVLWKQNSVIFFGFYSGFHILFALSFLQLRARITWLYKVGVGLIVFHGFCLAGILLLSALAPDFRQLGVIKVALAPILFNFTDGLFSIVAGVVTYWRGFKPALFFMLGTLLLWTSTIIYLSYFSSQQPMSFWLFNSNYLGLMGEMLFFLVGLTYKVNLLKKRQDQAIQQQLRLTQENQTLIESQNRVLEEKVEQRTAELRASQAQLIQKEKLASLGELTAGIAHEIQNPLNFVNNFSEVSTELVEEQKEALAKGDWEEAGFIADDLAQNLQKITHHGSRASAIVRGMLEHSRTSTGEKQPTNLNALADEYLRLAYQVLRAKDNNGPTGRFNCELVTDFAAEFPHIDVVPQDMGRVLLNLYNNAFYAVQERQKQPPTDQTYVPTVQVSTRQVGQTVEIRVRDNGMGIPGDIREKIFQPFFTTKPTGEGTGLGLSLSYDIITKGHSGTMTVESREGEGAEFIIHLPC